MTNNMTNNSKLNIINQLEKLSINYIKKPNLNIKIHNFNRKNIVRESEAFRKGVQILTRQKKEKKIFLYSRQVKYSE